MNNLQKNWQQEAGLEKKGLRDGFGQSLVRLAEKNKNIVVLTGDLCSSLHLSSFKDKFTDRFFQMGVAEQNMVAAAAGMAKLGLQPVVGSYATFLTGRAWEFIRVQICLNKLPVILVGSHAGLSHPLDGATAQGTEDVALMGCLPNMQILTPLDADQVDSCLKWALLSGKPTYIRLTREPTPIFLNLESIKPGSHVLLEGKDLTIASFGPLTYEVMQAADILQSKGVKAEVIGFSCLKPLNMDLISKSVKKTKRLLTVEDHQKHGGFGTMLFSNFVGDKIKAKLISMNRFGQTSRDYQELLSHFKLDRHALAKHALSFIK
jgi:transketolase